MISESLSIDFFVEVFLTLADLDDPLWPPSELGNNGDFEVFLKSIKTSWFEVLIGVNNFFLLLTEGILFTDFTDFIDFFDLVDLIVFVDF